MSELLEKILSKDNMNTAYKRVCANKGAEGVDEVTLQTATFRGQQGRISRPVKAILSGRL